MKKLVILLSIITIALISLVGANFYAKNRSQTAPVTTKIVANASFYPMYFFTSEIGGYKTEVNNLTPAGIEPHDYEPNAKTLTDIEKNKLLVLNGGVEPWADRVKANLTGTSVVTVTAGEGLLSKAFTDEDGTQTQDPHIWLDPVLAKEQAKKIAEGFITIDPKNQTYYENNFGVLSEKLDQLDAKYNAGLKSCQKKEFVTSHEAFSYLASRYGLTQVAISGLSPDVEPSLQQIADVAEYAQENNINYIFFESLVSPELSQTVADEIGAQTLVLDPLEGLSQDDSKQGKNYFTVMEENLKNLRIALQCN
ncbi:MAG: zinc ABC transporter substrate-binding protein [Patescibacteria group bacterium]